MTDATINAAHRGTTATMNASHGGTTAERPLDWQRAHHELVKLSHERARLDSDEARWLLRALRSGAHRMLGYASFGEYVERLFGYTPRWTAEKLRVAEALETLPLLSDSLAEGALSWSCVRELTRVATPETENDWLACAKGHTAREVERMVSGHGMGSRPDDPMDASAARHVLRFAVSAEVFAAFREARAELARETGGPLDDEAILLLMARRILGGPSDARQSSYQMALTVCERCKSGKLNASGEPVAVERAVVEMAACDAETFSSHSSAGTHVGARRLATRSIPPSIRRQVHHRDGGCCRVPGCRHAIYVDVHHIDPKAGGGSHDAENLITLCSAHHRAIHRGEIVVRGRAPDSLTFWHADRSSYDSLRVSPGAAVARATAFRALCSLGFREREARRALERTNTHAGHEESAEAVLRAALAVLTPPARSTRAGRFGPKAA